MVGGEKRDREEKKRKSRMDGSENEGKRGRKVVVATTKTTTTTSAVASGGEIDGRVAHTRKERVPRFPPTTSHGRRGNGKVATTKTDQPTMAMNGMEKRRPTRVKSIQPEKG